MRKKKTKRQLKVVEQSGYKYKPTPTIILKGQWLREFGFVPGEIVEVYCESGKLYIAAMSEQS